MGRSSNRPKNAINVQTYAELDRFVEAFADGKFNLLIIIGGPGLQKSRAVKERVGEDACIVEGNATPFGMYREVYEYHEWRRDANERELVVIDDVDSLYGDRNGVRLLKCLCQTELRKRVVWKSNATGSRIDGLPPEFETEAKVAIIANQWKTLNENVAAIQDRGHVVLFEPTSVEIHVRTAKWFWDQEIYDYIRQSLHLVERPSMRDYWSSWELKEAGLDWRACLLERWGLSGARLAVAKLKEDDGYETQEERAAAFVADGLGCRATYFNHAKKLNAKVHVPEITLTAAPPEPAVCSSSQIRLAR